MYNCIIEDGCAFGGLYHNRKGRKMKKENLWIVKTCLILIFIFGLFLLFGCKKNSGDGLLDPVVEVGQGFLTVLPVNPEKFFLFVNLGHLNQPGHTFPSDHGGFYLVDYLDPIPVLSPADMKVVEMSGVDHVNKGYTDYDLTLSVNNGDFTIVFGHLSAIDDSIMAQAPDIEEWDCITYSTGGDDYRRCVTHVNIPVSAGDTIASAGGNPGQFGMDFGTYDKNRKIQFASNRFKDDYKYQYTVSPLDYFTEEINAILIPQCGDYICGFPMVRTVEPIGGTIQFDIPGTAQGLWFKKGEPNGPEDPHIALIYDNVEPDIPVFSIGISIPDLDPAPYSFTPTDTGVVDREFSDVIPDGHIYRYNIQHRCPDAPPFQAVILLEMISATELNIEKQNPADGPVWDFTENMVEYER